MRNSKRMIHKFFATAMAGMLLLSGTILSEASSVKAGSAEKIGFEQASAVAKKNTKKNTTKNVQPAQVKKIKRVDPTFTLDVVDATVEFFLKEEGTPVKVVYDKKSHVVSLSDGKYGAKVIIAPVSMKQNKPSIKIYVPNEKWKSISLNLAQSNVTCKNIFKSGALSMNMDQSVSDLVLAKGFGSKVEANMNMSKSTIALPDAYAGNMSVSLNQTDLGLSLPENFAGAFNGTSSLSTTNFKLAGGYRQSDVKISALDAQVDVPDHFSSNLTGYEHLVENEKNSIEWLLDPGSTIKFLS